MDIAYRDKESCQYLASTPLQELKNHSIGIDIEMNEEVRKQSTQRTMLSSLLERKTAAVLN
jgi:hypothetical protein